MKKTLRNCLVLATTLTSFATLAQDITNINQSISVHGTSGININSTNLKNESRIKWQIELGRDLSAPVVS